MATDSASQHAEALQALINTFRDIQFLLKSISMNTKSVLRYKERYGFRFRYSEKRRVLKEVLRKDCNVLESEYQPIIEESLAECKQDAKLLIEYLGQMHDAQARLIQTLESLPALCQQRLADVRGGKHWITLAIRFCGLPIARWPKFNTEEWSISHSVQPLSPPFPDRLDLLLRYFRSNDPTPNWQEVHRRVDSFVDDLVAVAMGIGLKICGEPDGPYGVRKWCWRGEISETELTEKPYLLAKYLWERFDRRVSIAELTAKDQLFEGIDITSVQRQGSAITSFFLNENIPLAVETGGDPKDKQIWMTKLTTEK